MEGHTGRNPYRVMAGIALVVFVVLISVCLWALQPRATNDELLDLIAQLARAQGYTIYEIPKQTVPHGWEIGRKRMSVVPDGLPSGWIKGEGNTLQWTGTPWKPGELE